jgi:hypothetical protein
MNDADKEAEAMKEPMKEPQTHVETPAEKVAKAEIEQSAREQTEARRKDVTPEAAEALRMTAQALDALNASDADTAINLLESVTGKLEIVTARDPNLALAPLAATMETVEVAISTAGLELIRDEVRDAMRDGEVQRARRLLRDFASETIITIRSLPLATYPAAIKEVVRLIDDDKLSQAAQKLRTTLASVVETDIVLPHPLLIAQHLLREAQALSEKSDRQSEEDARLTRALDEAAANLERAEILGYGTRKDFREFHEQIAAIRRKAAGGKSGMGWFDALRSGLDDLLGRLRHRQATAAGKAAT